jgi:rare lipoprotein A
MDELTCAHKTLPLGTVVLFVAEDGSHEVARVTDRGPYVGLREFDFSRALADSLGDLDDGLYDVYWAVVGRDTSGLPYARGG